MGLSRGGISIFGCVRLGVQLVQTPSLAVKLPTKRPLTFTSCTRAVGQGRKQGKHPVLRHRARL